jgi:hypothetical protein
MSPWPTAFADASAVVKVPEPCAGTLGVVEDCEVVEVPGDEVLGAEDVGEPAAGAAVPVEGAPLPAVRPAPESAAADVPAWAWPPERTMASVTPSSARKISPKSRYGPRRAGARLPALLPAGAVALRLRALVPIPRPLRSTA